MKLKLCLLASCVFLLLSAMSCEPVIDTPVSKAHLVSIELTNLDYSNAGFDSTVTEIKRERYAIGVKCKLSFADESLGVLNEQAFKFVRTWHRTPQVITISGFSEKYPAGSDVTDCFAVEAASPYDLLLVLRNDFPVSGVHTFKVIFTRYDMTRVEKETQAVVLL